ncbi:hypothetical protein P152DRAFT_447219 [Eremomyces bilateralis CBS 781.70]|uniref:F-box domain-containing protein n=1 Tax=Eremomyces bilateralis CBS 781.70 TaxID=1392243 RepID=A0A6G1GA33_9PEZI|nr:uncharacterized protein P152DRAFT_447219 [Eremomyces bilateralis CBS 781.70]KAF1814935.1 hypothetical protein P152DRAFT_447219 [Eremomyces bilateralis CBS 781.70]
MASSSITTRSQYLAQIFELVELILIHLPPHDLIRYQLVSPLWKAVIDASPYLQSHLFLRTLASVPNTSSPSVRLRTPKSRVLATLTNESAIPNPLLTPRFFSVSISWYKIPSLTITPAEFQRLQAMSDSSPTTATWRRMLPIQDERGFRLSFTPTESASVSFYCSGATTMGEVVDEMLHVRNITQTRERRWKENLRTVLENRAPARPTTAEESFLDPIPGARERIMRINAAMTRRMA